MNQECNSALEKKDKVELSPVSPAASLSPSTGEYFDPASNEAEEHPAREAFQTANKVVSSELQKKTNRIQELEDLVIEKDKKAQELKEKLNKVQQEKQSLKTRLDEVTGQLKVVTKDKETFKKKLSEAEEQLADCKLEKIRLADEYQEKIRVLEEQLESEKEENLKKILDLTSEKHSLEKQLLKQDKLQAQLERDIEIAKRECSDCKAELANERLKATQKDFKLYKEKAEIRRSESDSQMKAKDEEIQKLKAENVNLKLSM